MNRQKNGPVKGPFWFHHLNARLSRHLQIVQHPVHGQLPQHDQLRNAQQHMPMRAVHQPGEVGGHGFGRGQGFAGVGQQFFAVDAGGDEVAGVGFEQRFSGEQGIEVVVEGAFGGLVEGL